MSDAGGARRIVGGRQRGSIALFFLLFLIPLLSFGALAIDVAWVAIARNQLQNAADAAASGRPAKRNAANGVGDASQNTTLCSRMIDRASPALATNRRSASTPQTSTLSATKATVASAADATVPHE
ncbi:pilus assembly protein TadG-related protein, partial [Burkholderia thailandensis]|uniref:pilus assembly protein TadG-related protein n=1 Tax=Burkholderia thailandensis TaxID=57975 RepID=UPI00217EC3CA